MGLSSRTMLSHLPPGEVREKMARIIDLAELCRRSSKQQVTDFLEPFLLKTAMDILRGLDDVSVLDDGGYPEAERKRLVLLPGEWELPDSRSCWLMGEVRGEVDKIGHRDYLGSLLGLGIRREKMGDLKLTKKGCAVLVDRDVAAYVEAHWNQVQRFPLSVRLGDGDEKPDFIEKGEEKSVTVASLRFDAIVAAIWHLSRSKADEAISRGLLRVNGLETSDGSRMASVKDILSLRGFGRAILREIGGPTKKGRIRITIWQPVDR
uniref:Uncharacterized conserved protein ylmH n=2 Tax=Heliobacterium mobile TaxID=28064 RepID=Q0PID2_HELMO|nr:uncharacterized conserved protein ylmH [Heliobacterium mobile]